MPGEIPSPNQPEYSAQTEINEIYDPALNPETESNWGVELEPRMLMQEVIGRVDGILDSGECPEGVTVRRITRSESSSMPEKQSWLIDVYSPNSHTVVEVVGKSEEPDYISMERTIISDGDPPVASTLRAGFDWHESEKYNRSWERYYGDRTPENGSEYSSQDLGSGQHESTQDPIIIKSRGRMDVIFSDLVGELDARPAGKVEIGDDRNRENYRAVTDIVECADNTIVDGVDMVRDFERMKAGSITQEEFLERMDRKRSKELEEARPVEGHEKRNHDKVRKSAKRKTVRNTRSRGIVTDEVLKELSVTSAKRVAGPLGALSMSKAISNRRSNGKN